jgi:protein-disulfide isomerase
MKAQPAARMSASNKELTVQSKQDRPPLSGTRAGRWLALILLLSTGCDALNKMVNKQGAASPTACADYAKKLCEEAGAESQTCTSVKEATGLMPAAACTAGMADMATTKKKLADARKGCSDLMDKLCAEIGPQTDTCEMVKTQVKSFPPDRCSMMMQHYAEVVADLKRREEKNKPLPAEKMAEITKPGAPAFGPDNATVTIVEFSDFQCPFCSRAEQTIEQVVERYGKQVRLVYRDFPLDIHPNAAIAARAAGCARAQGKYWEMNRAMFADASKLAEPDLVETARRLALDPDTFKACLESGDHDANIQRDVADGQRYGVSATPTFFINGIMIVGARELRAFTDVIDDELERAGRE